MDNITFMLDKDLWIVANYRLFDSVLRGFLSNMRDHSFGLQAVFFPVKIIGSPVDGITVKNLILKSISSLTLFATPFFNNFHPKVYFYPNIENDAIEFLVPSKNKWKILNLWLACFSY